MSLLTLMKQDHYKAPSIVVFLAIRFVASPQHSFSKFSEYMLSHMKMFRLKWVNRLYLNNREKLIKQSILLVSEHKGSDLIEPKSVIPLRSVKIEWKHCPDNSLQIQNIVLGLF